MKTKAYYLTVALMLLSLGMALGQQKRYVMVVHGGAGTILKKNMTPALENAYTEALRQALLAGYHALESGQSSVDAVERAIWVLEDNPLFNAGKGAVFTHDGRNELDASIMYGKTLEAGAVAGVSHVKHPISAARKVMEQSEHVMMVGQGAEIFAKEVGLDMVDSGYFYTKERYEALQKAIRQDSLKAVLDHGSKQSLRLGIENRDHKFGTVGCVALDKQGHLAAGTSTGGMTNKKYGRVGDSPIIGAGTYCDDRTAGISCTGWGEFFIRAVVAKSVSDLMEYKGSSIAEASKAMIDKVGDLGGDGGLIALDKEGQMAMPFNTEGMYRGAITEDGKIEIEIYK